MTRLEVSDPPTVATPGGGDPAAHVPGLPGRSTRVRPRRLRSFAVGCGVAAVVAVLLFAVLGTSAGGPGGGSSPSGVGVGVGSEAPRFTLPRLGGGPPVSLAAIGHGHPVVLNFFASWCPPCRAETPMLAATAAHLAATDSPVRVVGVDVQDPSGAAGAFVRSSGITYPVGADTNLHVAIDLYGLNGQPNTFFIDSRGVVERHVFGALTAATLADGVAAITPHQ
jgi:cytochrome c biogenesis protein CcmG, thiol:disulfide interchange protein DsbE